MRIEGSSPVNRIRAESLRTPAVAQVESARGVGVTEPAKDVEDQQRKQQAEAMRKRRAGEGDDAYLASESDHTTQNNLLELPRIQKGIP